jgi:hypothetical protein
LPFPPLPFFIAGVLAFFELAPLAPVVLTPLAFFVAALSSVTGFSRTG